MLRIARLGLTIAVLALSVSGCRNVERVGCEMRNFYDDVQRNIFGIDFPGGRPETHRQQFYETPLVDSRVCVD